MSDRPEQIKKDALQANFSQMLKRLEAQKESMERYLKRIEDEIAIVRAMKFKYEDKND
jgi:vacuolar-type H+-ATPase subunit D/Vma8